MADVNSRGVGTGLADTAYAGPKFPVIIIAPTINNHWIGLDWTGLLDS